MNTGLDFIPKYVRQDSDLAYGEKVTHENYNEKLNLNTTQGDYNTEVLFKLFHNIDKTDTYHIAYLDKDIEDINDDISTIQGDIDALESDNSDIHTALNAVENDITGIENGTITVQHAVEADRISSGTTAGPNKYYGTNENSELGFITLPEFIYAEDLSQTASVEGIYFIPMLNSVAENMLTAAVREKLNREAIVDYDYLDNKPKINSVTLTGNKSLSDLGIQPVGDYATNSGVTSAINTALTGNATQSWVNTQLGNYATTTALNTTNNNLSTTTTKANNAYTRAYACARVGVNAYPSSPQNGDLYFTVSPG